MEPDRTNRLSDDQLADLARFVDGTLEADRRAEFEAQVARSPQLWNIVERQSAALDALRDTANIGAPLRLRAHVDRRRGADRSPVRGRWKVIVSGASAAATAAALALILALPSARSDHPRLADVAALGHKSATQATPGDVPGTPQLLRMKVGDVPFPNYTAKFGWSPSGVRTDHPAGRDATTVYYQNGGRTIAYTIVSGEPLDPPADARSITRGGVQYRRFRDDGRTVVTWERHGHTCVLSGSTARPAELLTLADWRGKGAIPF
jgi:anti-sigma factor RsiW